MGHTSDLLSGIAEYLGTQGVGTWRATGVYSAGETGIVLGLLPQSPDAVISLAGYSVSDDATLSDSVMGVQVRTRTAGLDPRPTADLADAIFVALQGLGDVTLGGVRIQMIARQSWTQLGADSSQRQQRSDNYYVTTHYPSTHRT